jgi:hypothetical protein
MAMILPAIILHENDHIFHHVEQHQAGNLTPHLMHRTYTVAIPNVSNNNAAPCVPLESDDDCSAIVLSVVDRK